MAGRNDFQIKVEGLVQLQRALREADKALPREIKRALDKIARDVLVPMILRKMESKFVLPLGDSRDHRHRTGKLIRSVRAVSQQRAGIIKEGISATPYAGWWEFGGSTHSPLGNTDRTFKHEGRTLYPSLYESEPVLRHEAENVMRELVRIVETRH